MSLKDISILEKLYDQFNRETVTIKEHIEFMERSVVLNGLRENKKTIYSFTNDLDVDNIKIIQTVIDKLNEKNQDDISKLKDKIEKSKLNEIPEWFKSIDVRSQEGEIVDIIFEQIDDNIVDREEIYKAVSSQIEALCITEGENIDGDFYLNLFDCKERIYEYIDCSLKAYYNNSIFEDIHELQVLKNFEKLLRLVDTKNNINIYRQAFIQLVALFDAFVFECFEVQFSNNFFKWLKLFDKDNISLNEIANNNNFDDLKNMIIERVLKGLYLKDLLIILNENNPSLFNIEGKTKYANFREIINRRNCHIHNNGIIDKAYLGINRNDAKSKFNLHNFALGDYAEINKEYLLVALECCSQFIKNLIKIEIE